MKTEFIKNRQEEIKKDNPIVELLYNKLEPLKEGSMVVPMPETESEIFALLTRGKLFKGTDEMFVMETSRCHENSARLYMDNPGIFEIVTGYGYTENDFMWRQHTWLRKIEDKTIIETTVHRDAYFGVVLNKEEADKFAFYNE